MFICFPCSLAQTQDYKISFPLSCQAECQLIIADLVGLVVFFKHFIYSLLQNCKSCHQARESTESSQKPLSYTMYKIAVLTGNQGQWSHSSMKPLVKSFGNHCTQGQGRLEERTSVGRDLVNTVRIPQGDC